MKSYEMIREIFNECANNQMRDVDITEIETDDTDAVVREILTGSDISCEKSVLSNGTIIYDIVTDGIKQRVGFTEI